MLPVSYGAVVSHICLVLLSKEVFSAQYYSVYILMIYYKHQVLTKMVVVLVECSMAY